MSNILLLMFGCVAGSVPTSSNTRERVQLIPELQEDIVYRDHPSINDPYSGVSDDEVSRLIQNYRQGGHTNWKMPSRRDVPLEAMDNRSTYYNKVKDPKNHSGVKEADYLKNRDEY